MSHTKKKNSFFCGNNFAFVHRTLYNSRRENVRCLIFALMTIYYFTVAHPNFLGILRPPAQARERKIVQIFALRIEKSTVEKEASQRDYVIIRAQVSKQQHIRNITSNVLNDFDKYLRRFFSVVFTSCDRSRVQPQCWKVKVFYLTSLFFSFNASGRNRQSGNEEESFQPKVLV